MSRKRLDRVNLGQLRYGRKAVVTRDEANAEAAIGWGSFHMYLAFDDHSEDSNPRIATLRDLGFWRTEKPEQPSFENLFFDASDSEILILELNAILEEINDLLAKHPEKTKDECVGIVAPYSWTIDTDRISIVINQEYYHSFETHDYKKRKLPLTREEAIEFIERDVGVKKADLLPQGDLPDHMPTLE